MLNRFENLTNKLLFVKRNAEFTEGRNKKKTIQNYIFRKKFYRDDEKNVNKNREKPVYSDLFTFEVLHFSIYQHALCVEFRDF